MYKILDFVNWARTTNLSDEVYLGLEFMCTFDMERKGIYRLDMNQKVDGDWHTLHVFADKAIVSFNKYYEDTYTIDTTQFSTPITEEEYFQYCTIQDHLHLTEAEFRAIVYLSKFVEEYTC